MLKPAKAISLGVELRAALGAAQTGPVFDAELISLTDKGRLRVTYNWLYSALNCDPSDDSDFEWTFSKRDDGHIALSPKNPYRNMTLYASVRDDNANYLQVQAPYSADWIRAVGRDEILGLRSYGLLIVSLAGFNGQDLAVDSGISSHGGHAGYRVRSIGNAEVKARTWFLAIRRSLQTRLALPSAGELTPAELRRSLALAAVPATDDLIARLLASSAR